MIPLRARENGFVGRANCILSRIRQRSFVLRVAMGQQAKELIHCDRAGDFSGSRSAHAIAYHVDT
jgi:hypothetical protein